MGYRSTIYIKALKALEEELLTQPAMRYFEKQSIEDKDYVYYIAEELKWYESYEEVREMNLFTEKKRESMALLAIGEDNAIVEHLGDYCKHGLHTELEIIW